MLRESNHCFGIFLSISLKCKTDLFGEGEGGGGTDMQ